MAASLGAAAVTPESGLWAITSEISGTQPGRGFTVEVQSGVMVITVFAYDGSGSDAFYQASGSFSGTTFSATLNRYRDGPYFGGGTRSAQDAGSAGTVTISFSDSAHGTITLPGEAAKAVSKVTW